MLHKPVLLNEVITCLDLKTGMTVVDGTAGSGGHTAALLEKIGDSGKMIVMDQDPQAIERCKERFKQYQQIVFIQDNFKNLGRVLKGLNIQAVDAVILDVGFSSDQLEDSHRGFSFMREGPLDMRMNPSIQRSARDFVNDLPQEELERIFREYGEERQAKRLAFSICQRRVVKPIETTSELAETLLQAGPHFKHKGKKKLLSFRRHPATRVFQALRIAVNDELEVLRQALPAIWPRVKTGGRMAVITFHSLEDRIVKNCFRDWIKNSQALPVTKKPIAPSYQETRENPRARSAKLRVVEKVT